jgi:RND family efflux transporter MFP subunit
VSAPPRDVAGGPPRLDGAAGLHGLDRGGQANFRGVEARAAGYGVNSYTRNSYASYGYGHGYGHGYRYWPYAAAAAAYAYGSSYASSSDGCYYVSAYRGYGYRRVLVCHGDYWGGRPLGARVYRGACLLAELNLPVRQDFGLDIAINKLYGIVYYLQEAAVHPSVSHPPAPAIPRPMLAALALALLAMPLSACNDRSATSVEPAAFVHTETVQPRDGQGALTLTGEIQSRFRAELSFRVSGRVLARLVDVGAHVNAGDLLARLDPTEQQADFDAATAGVAAAESQLRVAQTTFDRQSYLLSTGFTTRISYDQAQEQLRTAQSTLESAKAELGRTREALGDTELHARAAGVITARNLEVGQVVQAAQSIFTLAQDGERDAVFDVPESMFLGDVETGNVSLALISSPDVTAVGYVREISPAVDPKSATVRVKVAIQDPPRAMTLGSAIAGTAGTKPATEITLPWTALTAVGSKPAVWIVDPRTKRASLKPVTVGAYEAGAVLIKEGLEAGDRVVVDGGKLLSSGQLVTFGGDRS